MTWRQKLVISAVAVALTLAAAIGIFVLVSPPSLASVEQKLEDVDKGMTQDQVVEIMGQPRPLKVFGPGFLYMSWQDDRGTAWVYFNDGKVIAKEYVASGAIGLPP